MIYQNILSEISPYKASVCSISSFGEHRHADIEIHYCIKGSLDVAIDKKVQKVNEGELLLVSPMVAHAVPQSKDTDRQLLLIIVGVSFLKNFFTYFSDAKDKFYLISPDNASPVNQKLFEVVRETVDFCQKKNETSDLLICGNLYKLCSYLIDLIVDQNSLQKAQNKEITKVANIEKALEMIYYDYAKPLTVEEAAVATGYGKSNFCKIFKHITGDTFHNVLNRRRVESACGLLGETNMPISQISAEVGFSESKTFCRVFKSITDLTPGQYRKSKKAQPM